MNEELTPRLNQILPKITSDEFLSGHGIGNEIAFHIFDYPEADELQVREYIMGTLLEHIPKRRPGLKVLHINLFEFLLDYLSARGLLEKSLRLQRDKGNEALLKALWGVLHAEKLARRFGEVAQPAEQDLVLISGVGSVYPMLRSHTLLSNLHSVMGQTPLVMFYPGRYDRTTLRLFGKTGLAGDRQRAVPRPPSGPGELSLLDAFQPAGKAVAGQVRGDDAESATRRRKGCQIVESSANTFAD